MAQLKKDDRLRLRVIKTQRFSNKFMYVVEYDGRQYNVPMFEFQYNLPLPEELDCLVLQVTDKSIYFKQNLSILISQRYTEGQVIVFTVDQDLTNSSLPHYKVSDGSGFYFKLPPQPDIRLTKKNMVKCRITHIRGTDVRLQYIETVHEHVKGVTFADIASGIGRDAMVLAAMFDRSGGNPDIEMLYDDGNPEWMRQFIDHTLRYFGSLTVDRLTAENVEQVEAFGHALTWFLEDSDYFDRFSAQECARWQETFANALNRTRAYGDAFVAVLGGSHMELVNRLFSKIAASGFLIDASRKMLTMRNIFQLVPDALHDEINRILTIASSRRNNIEANATFRRAFVELLQLYIDHNRRMLDEMDHAETDAAKAELVIMIKVIATLLLLADDADSDISDSLNRPRLYRYLTLRDNSGNDAVLHKAMMALLACEKMPVEYSWSDISEIINLTHRLRRDETCATLPAVFEGEHASLSASLDSITLTDNGSGTAKRVFPPKGVTLWNDLSVELTTPLPANLREPRTIPQYSRFWKEMERRVMIGVDSKSAARGFGHAITALPVRRQQVEVEIIGVDDDMPGRLLCRVVENGLHGDGWIDIRDISGSDRELPLDIFRDAAGHPLVFHADVEEIAADDRLRFSMTRPINEFLNSYISYDESERCVILSRIGESCMVLSDNGFICNVELDPDMDHLRKGDVIEVNHIVITGNWRQGDFVRSLGGRIDFTDVMRRLMSDYALRDPEDGAASDADEENQDAASIQEANPLSADALREMARIIESVGANEPQNNAAYNYFSFARLLALMADDEDMARYFARRCTLLEELDDFFTNGHVDLRRLEQMSPDLMRENNSITSDLVKLRILSVIDHNENNALLWNIFESDANESLQELARLVMAYNMLDGFKMREERQNIRHKLYSKLKMSVDREPEVIAGGMEGLRTEFKTSIVYPANSMRLDVPEQTKVILKVIASFMNTDGGTLYIGVSDEGYVRGLENDLRFFGRKDHFDRHVHDNIRKSLTFIPNLHHYVTTEWIECGGKDIYKVEVNPTNTPIAVEGVYYYREGSSCVMVRSEQEAEFIAARGGAPEARDAAPAFAAGSQSASAPVAAQSHSVDKIATASHRNNVLHDGFPDYQPVLTYLYVNTDLSITLYPDDRWLEDDSRLALALHHGEENGQLVIVGEDGMALRTDIAALTDNDQRLSNRMEPVFIAPMADDDRLFIIYRDSSGVYYKRMLSKDDIRQGRPNERGESMGRDIDKVVFCEIIPAAAQQTIKAFAKKQRIGRDESSADNERRSVLERLNNI